MATAFRLLVEDRYPRSRKAYNTLPDDNMAALAYVLSAGYRVEAHLAGQYREKRGELVVGKLLRSSPANAGVLSRIDRTPSYHERQGSVVIRDGNDLAPEVRERAVCDLLAGAYDEIDAAFVRAIEMASRASRVDLSKKSKRFFVALRGGEPVGLVVATPKRGHALKCSPLALVGQDPEAFQDLLQHAYSAFWARQWRKAYLHVPYDAVWLQSAARAQGFVVEGLLREPYKPGVDMVVLGRQAVVLGRQAGG
jgi:hypothetical protein